MNRQPQRRVNVSCVNRDGTKSHMGTWVPLPAPDDLDTNGFDQVGAYVARLIASNTTRSSLFIASPDGTTACTIEREAGQLKISVQILLEPSSNEVQEAWKKRNLPPPTAEPEKEQAVRELFEELKIAPDSDTVHDYQGYADALRHLEYPVGNEIDQATQIIQRFLSQIAHIEETDALEFTCSEFQEPAPLP